MGKINFTKEESGMLLAAIEAYDIGDTKGREMKENLIGRLKFLLFRIGHANQLAEIFRIEQQEKQHDRY